MICATAAGADAAALSGESFDLVVLDEATQAVDPIALAALCRAPRAVLAGDPHQLPPTVLDEEAERMGLGTTFFERLYGRVPDAVSHLEVQHRMHEQLMRFVAREVYDERLVALIGQRSSSIQHRLRPFMGNTATGNRGADGLIKHTLSGKDAGHHPHQPAPVTIHNAHLHGIAICTSGGTLQQ